MIKVSVLGATGYTGQELVRLLLGHPHVELVGLGSHNYVGQDYGAVYPHFRKLVNLTCRATKDPFLIEQADLVFLALPHGLSIPYVEKGLAGGKKVIDLGADFRLLDPQVYQTWYQKKGPAPQLLAQAVYGLPEIKRDLLKKTNLVANPGCYPTTVILALYPLLKEGLLNLDYLVVDSKSGVSGAGRGLKTTSLYSEANETLKAYGFPGHRHTPEIEQELGLIAEREVHVRFTPHLVPLTRGMLSTIYTRTFGTDLAKIREVYQTYYGPEPFIRLYPQGEYPQTKAVQGTNFCDLGFSLDPVTGNLTIVSVIDNLTKGAAGQALQNFNLMCGFPETLGLKAAALYP